MNARARLRPVLRRATDRVMQPYVAHFDEQLRSLRGQLHTEAASAPTAQPVDVDTVAGVAISDRFHATLHELRTLELERLAGRYQRVLSVGANGSWYFEWFRRSVGEVDEHIGVEAYEPKPDDLPAYVRWVTDTADHMVNVDTGSVDLVFAGQTSEHLWAHEVVGFLLEAHRVLREGGLLVLDSPNRRVTEHMHWSHGGHTVELDAAEISELLVLAGFEVRDVFGIWCSRLDDRVLALEEGCDDAVALTRRIALGGEHPDDSFVWWINAVRTSVAPSAAELERRTRELFASHWCTRLSRGFFEPIDQPRHIAPGRHDPVASTLPFPVHAGSWTLTLHLDAGSWDDVSDATAALTGPGDVVSHTFRLADAQRSGADLTWRFDQPELEFALSLSVSLETAAPLVLGAPLRLVADPI